MFATKPTSIVFGIGKVPSLKPTIFGFKLHLLVTLNGVSLDFDLAPASAADLTVGAELLAEHDDLTGFGDNGYISAQFAADLLATRGVRLLTLARRNQKRQLPQAICPPVQCRSPDHRDRQRPVD